MKDIDREAEMKGNDRRKDAAAAAAAAVPVVLKAIVVGVRGPHPYQCRPLVATAKVMNCPAKRQRQEQGCLRTLRYRKDDSSNTSSSAAITYNVGDKGRWEEGEESPPRCLEAVRIENCGEKERQHPNVQHTQQRQHQHLEHDTAISFLPFFLFPVILFASSCAFFWTHSSRGRRKCAAWPKVLFAYNPVKMAKMMSPG